MTKIFGNPSSFVDDAMAGFCDLYPQYVQPVPHGVIRSTATPEGKVAVVVGGGSGHYPAFAGYVGPGLADGAVAGNVFASPSTRWVYDVAKAANRGGGVLLGFGNYAGDILNFGLAAERLRAEGIPAELLVVTDDVASEGQGANGQRRGIAGDVVAFKIAGAAAEAGYDFDGVVRAARHANEMTRSMGIAFAGCTLPGETEPLFTVTDGHMGIGLGIHGEPGISEEPIGTPEQIAQLLVSKVLDGKPAGAPEGGRITVLVNGLGSTKYEELFLLYGPVAAGLREAGYEIVAPQVGELVTSLDMAGASLTVTWLDEELERLWTAPAQAPALSVGPVIETTPAPVYEVPEDEVADYSGTPEPAQQAGQKVAALIEAVRDALKDAEAELGRIDAIAGDGDHGTGMVNGSVAAAQAARAAADAGAGAASTLAAAGGAWADRAGGTSGVIWGVLLHAFADQLGDQDTPAPQQVAAGATASVEAVQRLAGARVGNKTMLDAQAPFAEALAERIDAGDDLKTAWAAAAQVSTEAAEATKDLRPQIGRARPLAERSLGHPDAGAISMALVTRTIADKL
ncbi:dihydroxyacetone kinase family protein [Paenibacillus sp. TRM 82003]|uniref:dihydroxyacetone kinase family protein n=1 Tax=Kineococcus sp. TRM81007 TaxID=2925831 RepID=UPI001F599E83|nr:dihydroxyacetone kinase family protein [Kineococcus sp. TRM81007]MCI2237617.1 dihydroxyacetone kinase family protein [Kineococcus sp. TRM81007]MCI3921635.1 dihydroxyacetone kinase family protein [Paenibacillus sp. TRM 82003]